MHTNKTKEEDAVILVRLCGLQLENKVTIILEKKTLEDLSRLEEKRIQFEMVKQLSFWANICPKLSKLPKL